MASSNQPNACIGLLAICNLILASVEAWVHDTRFTETTVYEATIVANAWRAWLVYMCAYHFVSFIFLTCFAMHGTTFVTFMAFPIKYVMNKFNCNSEAGFLIANFVWNSAIWLTMPILTILFWVPTSKGTWTPGCIPFAQLCNETLWATLRVTSAEDYNMMVNRYRQPQTFDCDPKKGTRNIRFEVTEDCDPFFGLGFLGFVTTFEFIFAVASLVLYCCILYGLIKGANDQRSTPMANQMVPLNHGPRPTKINIAVASMVQQRAILLFNSTSKRFLMHYFSDTVFAKQHGTYGSLHRGGFQRRLSGGWQTRCVLL